MDANFNQPQRQSKVGILVMISHSVYYWIKLLWIFLFIMILKGNFEKILFLIPIIIAFLVLVSVFAYLQYLNFTFYIDDEKEEFIISSGVFNKSKTIVQLNKIQQVIINQSFIQRLIGVYGLEIDTAGSDTFEASIKAISHELAINLKSRLLHNEKQIDQNKLINDELETSVSNERPFLKINLLSLIKIGITSNYVKTIGLIWITFWTFYNDLKHIGFDYTTDDDKIENFFESNSIIYSILILVSLIISFVFVINIVRTIIKFFNYTITKQKGSLVLFYGMITTKSTLLKPEKVQMVITSRNYIQKKIDVFRIKIKQSVGYLDEKNENIIEIPGCNELEKNEILQLIFKQFPEKGMMMKPNFRKLGFSIFLKIVLPLTAFYWFTELMKGNIFYDYYYFPAVYVVLMFLYLFFEFKNYRLFVNENYIIKQSGAWDIEDQIIQLDKIQALSTSQLFWHKNLNIGSLTMYTAGGNITFHLGKFDKIKQYVNLWLYQIEKSNSNWM